MRTNGLQHIFINGNRRIVCISYSAVISQSISDLYPFAFKLSITVYFGGMQQAVSVDAFVFPFSFLLFRLTDFRIFPAVLSVISVFIQLINAAAASLIVSVHFFLSQVCRLRRNMLRFINQAAVFA